MADDERRSRVRDALRSAQLDAVACALPMNVLMLSGYWPVLGTAVAICTSDGKIGLAVPEGEKAVAELAQPATVELFPSGSLDKLDSVSALIQPALRNLCRKIGSSQMRVGIEAGAQELPIGYSGIHFYAD